MCETITTLTPSCQEGVCTEAILKLVVEWLLFSNEKLVIPQILTIWEERKRQRAWATLSETDDTAELESSKARTCTTPDGD